ncbi:type II toxin-antitoxin system RelE/ParE family toxin [Neorhizobium sp. NCHU2750]|uniref:type II toxin-antitoxin system RelE/ParE family toxin n=1 Tax=Neorhizobium sp. NCHU2750 TaxID=1825976 RepID=UPI000E762B71
MQSGRDTSSEAALHAPSFARTGRGLGYLAGQSPQAAQRVGQRIREVLDRLCQHPSSGIKTDHMNMRRIVASPYPYIIFYLAEGDIVVVGVRHAARDPETMPGTKPSPSDT